MALNEVLAALADAPNMRAPQSSYSICGSVINVGGYQTYQYDLENSKLKPVGAGLERKASLLSPLISKEICRGLSVLDLGGNNGFFSLLSVLNGASTADVVDIDLDAVNNVKKVAIDADLPGLRARKTNVNELIDSADLVYAFALIHWVFDLTTGYGSLRDVLSHLRTLTKSAIVIEWVDKTDPKILKFDHIMSAGNNSVLIDYTEENFVSILSQLFDKVVSFGEINGTRRLYLACEEKFLQRLSSCQGL